MPVTPGVGLAQCTRRAYDYDDNSNRTSLTAWVPDEATGACNSTGSGVTVSSTYDDADRATKSGYDFDAFGRITSVPSADMDGGGSLTLTYFENDRVRTLARGGSTDTLSYDLADRTRQLVTSSATTTWHYSSSGDSPAWISENEAGTSWTRNILGPNGQLVAIANHADASTLQLTDLHGDVVATASSSESAPTLTSAADQTEFGAPRSSSTARYGWLGGHQRAVVPGSGALLMGARVYVPSAGRFTQVDPVVGGSANSYEYCRADPVNCLDLSGLYSYYYRLVDSPTPWALKALANRVCPAVFPMWGCVGGFRQWQILKLQAPVCFFIACITRNAPVYVSENGFSHFKFTSLPGHPQGAGATITFRFERHDDGHNWLHVSTSAAEGGWLTDQYARAAWGTFAFNIRAYWNRIHGI
jgi:RHS repeat-associated protein